MITDIIHFSMEILIKEISIKEIPREEIPLPSLNSPFEARLKGLRTFKSDMNIKYPSLPASPTSELSKLTPSPTQYHVLEVTCRF